ncbi:MAG: sensor histidine kinase [Vicinamibacteria bacterium]
MAARGPAPRSATRERRRTHSGRLLLRRGARTSLLAGIAVPLELALKRLAPASQRVRGRWLRRLRRLSPGRAEFDALSALDARTRLRIPRDADLDHYAEVVERQGHALALRGIPEEHAVLALAFNLEGCLQQLLCHQRDEREMALALVRLTAAIQRFVLAGYARARAAGWQRSDEEERKRLSRDLHDEIGGDLIVLKLYIEMILLELGRSRLELARHKLEEALALVAHALDSVRRLTLDLGPAILEKVGLLTAAKLYCRHFSARTGVALRVVDADVPDVLPAAHQTTLYRVLQGALSNVAKHSRARAVNVTLGCLRRRVLVMVIEDDGVGFDVGRQSARAAYGLTAMRDRIESLGGRLHIESRGAGAGGRSGTRIEVDLPIEPVPA